MLAVTLQLVAGGVRFEASTIQLESSFFLLCHTAAWLATFSKAALV